MSAPLAAPAADMPLRPAWPARRDPQNLKHLAGCGLLIALLWMAPWLNPFSSGASAAFVPIAVGWLCAAGLLILTPWRWSPAVWCPLLLAAVIALRGPWEPANIAAAWSGLGLVALGIGFGAAAVRSSQKTALALALAALLAAALVSAALALLQYFDLDHALGLGSWINHTAAGEAYANLRQRNHLATLLSVGLACLVWCMAQGRLRQHGWWMLVLLMAGSAASSSRTGVVQIAALAALGWCWRSSLPPRVRWLLAAALPAYVVAWWLEGLGSDAMGGAFVRFAEAGAACSSRLVLWHNVLDLIAARPWLGWGWGELDYAHYVSLYPGARFCAILDNAHNLPLHLAVELGLPVALLCCAVASVACVRARPWREADATRQAAWMIVLAIGIHALLEYPLWYAYFEIAFGLALGCLWTGRAPAPGSANSSREAPGMHIAMRALAGVALLGGLAAVWTDYQRMGQLYLAPDQRSAAYQDDTEAKVRQGTWLFTQQVRFADLTTRAIGPANAAESLVLAHSMLHFSPEPRVVEQALVAAVVLGRDDVLRLHWPRFRAAFPDEAAAFEASPGWAAAQMLKPAPR